MDVAIISEINGFKNNVTEFYEVFFKMIRVVRIRLNVEPFDSPIIPIKPKKTNFSFLGHSVHLLIKKGC